MEALTSGCEVRKALHKPGLIIATQSVFSEGCQPHPGVISFPPRRLSGEGEKARGHKKGRPLITSNGRVISRLVSVTGPANMGVLRSFRFREGLPDQILPKCRHCLNGGGA